MTKNEYDRERAESKLKLETSYRELAAKRHEGKKKKKEREKEKARERHSVT